MSWSFKPGDRVVCVDADGRRNYGSYKAIHSNMHGLREQGVYTIGRVADYAGVLCVWLKELRRPHEGTAMELAHGEAGYAAVRFRPVRTTSIESLRAHLNTIPANRSVDA